MSAIPAVNSAYAEESPAFAPGMVAGAFWSMDFRDRFPVASDEIHNHDQPAMLGVLDGTESVADWNPYEGSTYPQTVGARDRDNDPVWGRFASALRFTPGGDDATTLQVWPQAAPLAIDTFDRHPDHGQMLSSGYGGPVAGEVPLLEPPQSLPYHYDMGDQIDMGSAIGPRQVFRSPPSISDQTAAVYAAGF